MAKELLTCSNRAPNSIAQGALTNSKRPESFVKGVYPTHIVSGEGSVIVDEKGKKYVDYICSLGANYFGHGNDEIRKVINQTYSQGAIFSLGSTLEVEAAEKVKEFFPCIERLKFYKNGGDACSAAIRIARAFHKNNKREIVLSDGYHGNHDEFISLTPPASGCYKDGKIKKLDFNLIPEAACVIIEAVLLDYSEERREYLQKLRNICNAFGTILIFDEVITGLRFPKFSVANYFGIQPDLICLGKALAGGLPISIVGGRRDLMETDYFYSTTFSGDRVALAAMMKCLEFVKKDPAYSISALWEKGLNFITEFNKIFKGLIYIEGYPIRGAFKAKDDLTNALIFQEFCLAGILFGPSFFYNFCHPKHDHQTLSIAKDIRARYDLGLINLKGDMPKKSFAQIARKE